MRAEGRQWARATVKHAGPNLVEGTVIPLVLFTAVVHSVGMTPALWASLLWAGLAFGRRVWRGSRISGVLVLTGVGTAFRLATVVWTASPFVFFLQPVLATVAVALAFGLSVPLRRPLAARLGGDLVPLDEAEWRQADVRRACSRLSLVWCAALMANAGLTLWMLYHFPVATFVLLRPFVGVFTTLPAIIVSFVVGSSVVHRSGGRIRLPGHAGVPACSATLLDPGEAVTVGLQADLVAVGA
jgi:hypothetical protein